MQALRAASEPAEGVADKTAVSKGAEGDRTNEDLGAWGRLLPH